MTDLNKLKQVKFSVYDRNAVLSIDMGEMFLRDGLTKLKECHKRKTSTSAKAILGELIEEVESISKRLLDINTALVYNFTQTDVNRFAKISDAVRDNVIETIKKGIQ